MNEAARLQQHYVHIARFVLEADSAFTIASGLSDMAFDNLVVRDANNLPTIPGTTIAGVLRQLYRENFGQTEAEVNQIFGHQDKTGGMVSRVEFSWGVIHDSRNQPVEQLLEIITDPILERLAQDHPLYRDRVRINKRGVAEHQAKFDTTVIPKGCRFSFEITLWADQERPNEWTQLLQLIQGPRLRLGACVRTGMGKFKCIRLYEKIFDLKNPQSYATFSHLESSLGHIDDWQRYSLQPAADVQMGRLMLTLEPEDLWRIGQGSTPLNNYGKTPDSLPYVEPVIRWEEGQENTATFDREYVVVPGSSIKGAIRHRFSYHYARQVLDQDDTEELAKQAANRVFGFASNIQEGRSEGQAGRVYFSDCYIDTNDLRKDVMHMTHTSIDRFTGGVRYGVLFMEELIWKHPLKLEMEFETTQDMSFDAMDAQALQWTLDDLTQGRLALGAGSSKGHGYFQGEQQWQAKPVWISAIGGDVA